jgi:hypothetical protein
MVFGHNSNVAVGSHTVHVQTEDRGVSRAIIDTTVYCKGRVLHRRTVNYKDLLPLDASKEAALKARVDDQHRAVVEEIRSGALRLAIPKARAAAKPARTGAATLRVDLTNARTWLSGNNATLQVLVHDSAGNPVADASAKARVEGAASPFESVGQTGAAGIATLQFEMPQVVGEEAALVIEVVHNGAKGRLRFQLRLRPRA